MKSVAITICCCLVLGLAWLLWPVAADTPVTKDAAAGETPVTEDAAAAKTPLTEDEKTIYALGVALGQNLDPFNLTEAEVKLVVRGLTDRVLGRQTQVKLEEYGPKFQALSQARAGETAKKEKTAAAKFLEAEAGKPGAVQTESGLIYTELDAGTGASPKPTDTVTVHYHGTLRDGSVFDSSRDRGEPATFPLSGVIKGWTEGLQRMKVGGKARLVCPSQIAYGDQGRPPKIPGGAALAFDVELISISAPGGAPGGDAE